MPLYNPPAASASISAVRTYPFAISDVTSIDVNANTATWGGVILADTDVSIKTLQACVYQQATGNVQGAIYDAATNARIDVTDSVSVAATGFVVMTFATAVSLTKGTRYYLAVSCTANGSRFVGCSNATATYNNSPKPSFNQFNSQLPATLNPSASANLIWLSGFPP